MSMTNHDRLEDRIEELETRAAFQEDHILQLNGIVAEQEQRIALLVRKIELLGEQMNMIESTSPGQPGPSEEIPPHY